MEILRFQPWNSAPDVSFWQKLAALKLNTFQLSDKPQPLVGYFTPGRSSAVPSRFTVDESSFVGASTDDSSSVDRARYEWQAPGILYNTNTLEEFKTIDKTAILEKAAISIRELTATDAAGFPSHAQSLDALNSFVLVTFADLKKHSFLYWFGFPALSPTSTTFTSSSGSLPQDLASILSQQHQVTALKQLLATRQQDEDKTSEDGPPCASVFVMELKTNDEQQTHVKSVRDFASWRRDPKATVSATNLIFGFVDPCPLPTHPGWPMRNLLALLSALPMEKLDRSQQNGAVRVLAFREHVHHLTSDSVPEDFAWHQSLVFHVQLPVQPVDASHYKVVGWETNARGKLGPRLMELGGILDPIRLAEQSVDLNLKLMLWRQLPTLNLELLSSTKCLLLGAGTLGCFTARSLLAWGIRDITFVDNSTVSHSNPVRQPLFEFQDCGKPKAQCAANALQRIFPLVRSQGVHLTIPMAGHALSNPQLVAEAQTALTKLEELIDAHDVVFLGTDSRESRWLPTVICAAKKKLLLNAALGFDSYLVMRHGVGGSSSSTSAAASHHESPLGCYFCNDIVSPRDSLKDRTLDQMCTVTRPGLAPIAAATAVELLVALLHCQDGPFASAALPSETPWLPLAYMPHQLRGDLTTFSSRAITGQAFDKCIACSAAVIREYTTDGFTLLKQACDSTTFLEQLTGLHALTEQVDALMVDFDDSDEDGDML